MSVTCLQAGAGSTHACSGWISGQHRELPGAPAHLPTRRLWHHGSGAGELRCGRPCERIGGRQTLTRTLAGGGGGRGRLRLRRRLQARQQLRQR